MLPLSTHIFSHWSIPLTHETFLYKFTGGDTVFSFFFQGGFTEIQIKSGSATLVQSVKSFRALPFIELYSRIC
jgi:hypothetical protein